MIHSNIEYPTRKKQAQHGNGLCLSKCGTLNLAWWKIMIGFVVMHYTAGIILSVVFQLAHITTTTAMPLSSETGTMKNTWAIHQLFTNICLVYGGTKPPNRAYYINIIKISEKLLSKPLGSLICPITNSKLFAPPSILTISYSNHWQKNQSQYNLDDERSIIESD